MMWSVRRSQLTLRLYAKCFALILADSSADKVKNLRLVCRACKCTNFAHTYHYPPCPPLESITTLMTVWRITGLIILCLLGLCHCFDICTFKWRVLTILGLGVARFCVSVKVKLSVLLLCINMIIEQSA